MSEDHDAGMPPVPSARLARMKRVALAKFIRHQLVMSREQFSLAYGIPVETLRSWERHEAEPTPGEMAYLKLIQRAPELARLEAAE